MSKTIPLTRGFESIVDDDDFEAISKFKWHACGYEKPYARRKTIGRYGWQIAIPMHRQICPPPPGHEVDHRNGNRLDNRKANLRIATRAQNNVNQHTPIKNKSGFIGVYFSNGSRRWRAHIRHQGRTIHSPLFDVVEEAARAYDAMALKYHGEFARLNFPNK